jgi:hypothetical protein
MTISGVSQLRCSRRFLVDQNDQRTTYSLPRFLRVGCEEWYHTPQPPVVSKYRRDRRNSTRIFRAEHSSNAVLLFDEVDALFGKRSEINDAHERYANIEAVYLLQEMD